MKQMRSRFRLLTFLLACAFMLVMVLCAGRALNASGITLSSVASVFTSVFPGPAPSPSAAPADDPAGSPLPSAPVEDLSPGTDISPGEEYNIYGL